MNEQGNRAEAKIFLFFTTPKLALGLTRSPNPPVKATSSRNRSTTATGAKLKNAWSYRPIFTPSFAPMFVISTDTQTGVFVIRPTPFPTDTVLISDAYASDKLVTIFFLGGGGGVEAAPVPLSRGTC
jgi:hypothetical protein